MSFVAAISATSETQSPATQAAPLAVTPTTGSAEGFAPPTPSRTPRLLRQVQVVAALVVGLITALGVWAVLDLRADVAAAPSVVDQYVRVGQIERGLIEAGNQATLAVINTETASGSHATASMAQLTEVSSLLVAAAQARPSDGPQLQQLAAYVMTYSQQLGGVTGLTKTDATARLATADDQLSQLRAGLAQLQGELLSDATAGSWAQNLAWMVVASLVALAVLAWLSWLVARRTHRVLNLGLVAALVAVLVTLAFAVSAQGSAGTAGELARGTELQRMVNVANGTTQLAVARQMQLRAVLQQNWGAAEQDEYSTAFAAASAAADKDDALPGLNGFKDAHTKLADLLSKSDWPAAAKLVLDDADGSLAAAATRFDDAAARASTEAVQAATDATAQAQRELLVPLMVIIAVGILGALFAVLGIAQRIKEYL